MNGFAIPYTIVAAVFIGIFGWLVARFDNYLTLREHLEYKANQEATSLYNRQQIDALRDRVINLQHEIDIKR